MSQHYCKTSFLYMVDQILVVSESVRAQYHHVIIITVDDSSAVLCVLSCE